MIEQPPAADDVAAELAKQFSDVGYRVKRDSTRTICEIWLCKELELAADFEPSNQRLYPFEPGQLIGLVHYSRKTTDFRGQSISRGWYTLRYGLQPVDGNHVGTSPTRDFLLLVAAENDEAKKAWDLEELEELSAEAAGSAHPAMICLQKPSTDAKPLVRHNEETDWWILHVTGQGVGNGMSASIATRSGCGGSCRRIDAPCHGASNLNEARSGKLPLDPRRRGSDGTTGGYSLGSSSSTSTRRRQLLVHASAGCFVCLCIGSWLDLPTRVPRTSERPYAAQDEAEEEAAQEEAARRPPQRSSLRSPQPPTVCQKLLNPRITVREFEAKSSGLPTRCRLGLELRRFPKSPRTISFCSLKTVVCCLWWKTCVVALFARTRVCAKWISRFSRGAMKNNRSFRS